MKFCSLYSGSSGNCIFVGNEDTKILIDAGVSGAKIEKALCEIGEDAGEIKAILITHEHQDHIAGAGVLSRRFNIPLYAGKGTWNKIDSDKLLSKLNPENRITIETGKKFSIGTLSICSFNVPHDAASPMAYCVKSDCRKISVVTDMGFVTDEIRSNVTGSDIALIESNHDIEMLKFGRYPMHLKRRIMGTQGHLSNEGAAELITYLADKGTKHFVLGHLSKENNLPALAYEAAKSELLIKGYKPDENVFLSVAPRDCVGKVIEI